MTLGNGSGTDFGASQCIPMGPCLPLPLTLTLDAQLDARCGYSFSVNIFLGFLSQRSIWPRGKVLGGSSSINALMWIRGSRHDYDLWSKLGATGWNYSEVLPYFIRSENNQDKEKVKSGN